METHKRGGRGGGGRWSSSTDEGEDSIILELKKRNTAYVTPGREDETEQSDVSSRISQNTPSDPLSTRVRPLTLHATVMNVLLSVLNLHCC